MSLVTGSARAVYEHDVSFRRNDPVDELPGPFDPDAESDRIVPLNGQGVLEDVGPLRKPEGLNENDVSVHGQRIDQGIVPLDRLDGRGSFAEKRFYIRKRGPRVRMQKGDLGGLEHSVKDHHVLQAAVEKLTLRCSIVPRAPESQVPAVRHVHSRRISARDSGRRFVDPVEIELQGPGCIFERERKVVPFSVVESVVRRIEPDVIAGRIIDQSAVHRTGNGPAASEDKSSNRPERPGSPFLDDPVGLRIGISDNRPIRDGKVVRARIEHVAEIHEIVCSVEVEAKAPIDTDPVGCGVHVMQRAIQASARNVRSNDTGGLLEGPVADQITKNGLVAIRKLPAHGNHPRISPDRFRFGRSKMPPVPHRTEDAKRIAGDLPDFLGGKAPFPDVEPIDPKSAAHVVVCVPADPKRTRGHVDVAVFRLRE